MSIMVTGGAGYIGSHVVRLLEEDGREVIVVDDLTTGIVDRIRDTPLVQVDIAAPGAELELEYAMTKFEVDAVVHFAAKKQVGESVERPNWYYRQNVGGLSNLLDAMNRSGVRSMVFSSSAAVYGMPGQSIVDEDVVCQPINPYGQTKLIGEWMIDNARINGLHAVKLRYFNVAGAGWDDLADTAVTNLVPIVLDAVSHGREPVIFGSDYPTEDGTCIRDYIHVMDLARAHIAALEHLGEFAESSPSVFNVGTGHGASVKEVIKTVGSVLGKVVDPVEGSRRPGDPHELVADATLIRESLGWKAEFGLREIVESATRSRGIR